MMQIFLTSRLYLLTIMFCLSALALSASTGFARATMQNEAVAEAGKTVSATTHSPQTSPASSAASAGSHESPQERIEADTKKLYELALELRTEVGKTYKQSLSVDVLKKAGELERLAKNLKSELDHQASAKKR